jgi:hypothetical protein
MQNENEKQFIKSLKNVILFAGDLPICISTTFYLLIDKLHFIAKEISTFAPDRAFFSCVCNKINQFLNQQ